MALIYLAGPMSFRKDTDYNYPAFNDAAARLRAAGHMVINPAEKFGGDTTLPRWQYLAAAIADVAILGLQACQNGVDGWLVVLDGWSASRGALLEVAIAREFALPIKRYAPLSPIGNGFTLWPLTSDPELKGGTGGAKPAQPEPIEVEARRIVSGIRNKQYDEPEDNFRRIGQKWGASLDHWEKGTPVPPETVALMMVDLKTVREAHKHQRDNLTDAIGYILCLDRINERGAS